MPGVSALQSGFRINHLLEIVREHKKNLSCCADHVDEELKLFCETCNKVICCKCAFPGGQQVRESFPNHQTYETLDMGALEQLGVGAGVFLPSAIFSQPLLPLGQLVAGLDM